MTELYKKRKNWVDSTVANNFDSGINNLLTELYPDSAHFIYELLQNAEDTQATEVSFELNSNELKFIHNGRKFNAKDVEGITSIGQGTKADDINQIGKFGVGFKAVFSYTNTPYIYSGDYNFKIEDLVVPIEIEQKYDSNKTIMVFPFNNKKKNKDTAFQEVKKGLLILDDNTLLFLNNIKTINYSFDNIYNSIQRKDNEEIKVTISNKYKNTKSHWLRFKKFLPNSNKLYVSVAYKLSYDEILKNDIIVPIEGKVSIFFPAEKESSNLKFHIHAPFASTVARDSIKDLDENNQLRDLLAELISESLEYIKNSDLLDFNFIKCLPIDDDNLSNFYKPIQEKLINTFNDSPYVITDKNGFKPAKNCYKSSAEIKRIVDLKFLKLLVGSEDNDIYWAKNAPQKNSRVDKFIISLNIKEFSDNDFISSLLNDVECFDELEYFEVAQETYNYLNSKSDKWFGILYSYLYSKLDYIDFYSNKIIRLTNNDLNIYSYNCYFSDNESNEYKTVQKETYTLNRKSINERAKRFLEHLGITEIGDKEKIELILRDKYSSSKKLDIPFEEYLKDIELFLKYFQDSNDITVFQYKYFLLDTEKILQNPHNIIIDSPYLDTKMKLLIDNGYFECKYYGTYVTKSKKYLLTNKYLQYIDLNLFVNFLKKLGVTYKINIIRGNIKDNEEYKHLTKDYHKTKEMSATKIEQDWILQHIDTLLNYKNFEISLLVWKTMINSVEQALKAKYRPNMQYPIRESDSTLIQHLKKYPWIPDTKGNFYLPQDISREMLPKEFVYDDRNGWLSAINFGENIKKSQKEYQEANKIIKEKTGLSLDVLEEARKLGIDENDLKELIKQKKAEKQKLKDSLRKNQGSGDSPEIIQAKNDETLITDEKKYQKGITQENKDNKNQLVEGQTKYKSQDSKELQKIKDFLYKEYEGHCQICGDTFAYKDKNIFKIKSLNIGKNRDINRKGNTLCICCKHHKVLD